MFAMPDVLRVLLCDDHPVVRQGLRAFFASRPGIDIVGEAADGEEAVRKARHLKPDVVLMDLVLPGIGGVEAITRIRRADETVKLIVLTSFADDSQVVPAIRAGASAYLLKDVEPAALEEAVRAVARGDSLLHPRVTAAVLQEVSRDAASDVDLTPREREVLALIAKGMTNRRIARQLTVSEKTVKTHVSNVLGKLGVADRTQAALYAVRHGLAAD